jgi:hypothetical protein
MNDMTVLNNPIPREWDQYVTQQANGQLQIVPYIMYFKATYITATTGNTLDFFNTVPASDAISNVKQPGILPAGQSMLIQAIRVHIENNIEVQDMGAADAVLVGQAQDNFLIQEGVLRMNIGTKPQGPWPIHCLPSGTGAEVMAMAAAGAEAANLVVNQADLAGPMYALFPNLLIANLQQFSAQMAWAAALTLSITNKNIWLMFDGQLARPIE